MIRCADKSKPCHMFVLKGATINTQPLQQPLFLLRSRVILTLKTCVLKILNLMKNTASSAIKDMEPRNIWTAFGRTGLPSGTDVASGRAKSTASFNTNIIRSIQICIYCIHYKLFYYDILILFFLLPNFVRTFVLNPTY